MLMSTEEMCKRCKKDTALVKLFSSENNTDPGKLSLQQTDLTVVEEQLISRITPCIPYVKTWRYCCIRSLYHISSGS